MHEQVTMSDNRQHAKRWCFTINMATPESRLDELACWGLTPSDGPQGAWYRFKKDIQYLHFQEERGEEGTLHLQGFVIFKKEVRLSWLKKFHARAHWEVTRGTNQQADDYCKKKETKVENGMELTIGEMPAREAPPKKDERLSEAAEEVEILKTGYKRPQEIGQYTLLQAGFVQAYKLLTADVLGPYRPSLKILTLIGRPGVGKSFAIQKWLPNHGRCIYGNNGCWFQNPTADVMVFEEFCGQIPLQRMLQLLDPYPLALEVKGSMAPAMYTKVIITSNTPPNDWYKGDEAGQPGKRTDSIKALWDRLGYSNGLYIPVRKTGTYLQDPMIEVATAQAWFDHHVHLWATNQEQDVEDITDEEDNGQGCPAATAAADEDDLNAQD